jgi:hypothetical protein
LLKDVYESILEEIKKSAPVSITLNHKFITMSASTVAATNPNDREVNPMHLSLEQLNNLKLQNEEELQELQRQLETLHGGS